MVNCIYKDKEAEYTTCKENNVIFKFWHYNVIVFMWTANFTVNPMTIYKNKLLYLYFPFCEEVQSSWW
jgi:hypothetical protein